MLKYIVSDLTASGDTVKTWIGTVNLPANTKMIVGAWSYGNAAATLTSGEPVTGIVELESPDVNLQPCQLPLDQTNILTSGAATSTPKVWPMNVPIQGAVRVSGYITMDVAQTGALKARFGLVVDVG